MDTLRDDILKAFQNEGRKTDDYILDTCVELYRKFNFTSASSFVQQIIDFSTTRSTKALNAAFFATYRSSLENIKAVRNMHAVDIAEPVFDDDMFGDLDLNFSKLDDIKPNIRDNVKQASPVEASTDIVVKRKAEHQTPTNLRSAPDTPYSARLGTPSNYHTQKHKDSGKVVATLDNLLKSTEIKDMFSEQEETVSTVEFHTFDEPDTDASATNSDSLTNIPSESSMTDSLLEDQVDVATMYAHIQLEKIQKDTTQIGPVYRHLDWNHLQNVKLVREHMEQVANNIVLSTVFQQHYPNSSFQTLPFRYLKEMHTEEGLYYGRIISDDDSCRFSSTNLRLQNFSPLDLRSLSVTISLGDADLKNYSLFPGQVVIMKGHNHTGNRLVPSVIYTEASCTNMSNPYPKKQTKPLHIIHASGPYERSSELGNGALGILLDAMIDKKVKYPDALILTGPFLEEEHKLLTYTSNSTNSATLEDYCMDITVPITNDLDTYNKLQVTYETLRTDLFKRIKERLDEAGAHTKVIIIPSVHDLDHPNCLPQPPFRVNPDPDRFIFVGNPGMINIDGVNIATTSLDVLKEIGSHEVAVSKIVQKRYVRAISNFLSQNSFLTLSTIPLNRTLEKPAGDWRFKTLPDIVLTPSIFRYFAERVPLPGNLCSLDDTAKPYPEENSIIAINVEKSMKGETPGLYASIMIQPGEGTVSARTSVDIIRL